MVQEVAWLRSVGGINFGAMAVMGLGSRELHVW